MIRRAPPALVAVVFVAAACGAPPVATSLTPSATASSAATASSTPTIAPTATATPNPAPSGFRAGTLLDWPAVDIYALENDGNAHRYNEKGDAVIGRVCDQPRRAGVTGDGRTVLGWCAGGGIDLEDMYRLTPRPQRVVSGVLTSWPADLSPDGRQAVAFERGTCEPTAPVCQTRAVLLDLAAGTKRDILPSNYYLGSRLGWTALGLTHFQPQCAEAGCVGIVGDRDGTWVWDGVRFVKKTSLRFVARNGLWELYEKLRSFSDPAQPPRQVIRRGPGGDMVVTPSDQNERALAVGADGSVLAWRTSGEGGTVVRYDAGLRPVWSGDVTGVVTGVAGTSYFITLDYATPNEVVRLYDAARGLVFGTPLSGVRGAAVVLR